MGRYLSRIRQVLTKIKNAIERKESPFSTHRKLAKGRIHKKRRSHKRDIK
jgi:hypothetical protein